MVEECCPTCGGELRFFRRANLYAFETVVESCRLCSFWRREKCPPLLRDCEVVMSSGMPAALVTFDAVTSSPSGVR